MSNGFNGKRSGRGGKSRGGGRSSSRVGGRGNDVSLFDIFPSYLIIVESPSKCKKIEEYLGANYMCIASRGHLRHIDKLAAINFSAMGLDAGTRDETMQKNICGLGGGGVCGDGLGCEGLINFSVLDDKKQHVEYMQKIIRKFLPQNIYLATDFDREGEAIAWHICDLFGLSVADTKRIYFTEITRDIICRAVAECGDNCRINMGLVRSQWSRQVIDIVIGFNISPLLWKYVYASADSGLSAGRCQTPALRLIYDNYREIEKRELNRVYKISGVFRLCNANLQKLSGLSGSGEYKFTFQKDFVCEADVERFMSKSRSPAGLPAGYAFNMAGIKKVFKNNPSALNTSRLLQMASSACSLSTKQIMAYCQILYQDGHITYMRTESTKYSAYFLNKVVGFVGNKWGSSYLLGADELQKMTAGNDEPHEAIRVTSLDTVGCVSYDDRRISALYKLIWKVTLQSCMAKSIYKSIDLTVSVGGGCDDERDDGSYYYIHNIQKLTFSGWEIVGGVAVDVAEFDLELYLRSVETVIPLPINISANLVVENKKSHFTEATLIKKLDDLGIGRPSTYSLFIETIQNRLYVNKMDFKGYEVECKDYYLSFDGGGSVEGVLKIKNEKKVFGKESNKLIIQPLGILVIEFLVDKFGDLFSYNYTTEVERTLDIISCGKSLWPLPCIECYRGIKLGVSGIKNLQKFHIDLGGGFEFVFQKYGAVIRTLDDGGGGGGDVGVGGGVGENKKSASSPKYKYIKLPDNFEFDYGKLIRGEYSFADFIPVVAVAANKFSAKLPVSVYIEDSGDENYANTGVFLRHTPVLVDFSMTTTSPPENATENFIEIDNTEKMDVEDEGDCVECGRDVGDIGIESNKNILRHLNADFSIRKGKYGSYIFYKTEKMKKPQFLKLKFKGFAGVDGDKFWYMNRDVDDVLSWIRETYNV